MDGLTVSLITLTITVFISLLVAAIVQLMTMALARWPVAPVPDLVPPQKQIKDEAEIAAVIAIAQAQIQQKP